MNPEDSLGQEPPMNRDGDPVSTQRERTEEEIRKLGAATIGVFLKYKRQEKNLTLDEIDLITHIGPRWTEAIEEGEWSLYPSLLYAKGHIRGYCEALDVPGDFLLDYYSKELMTAFPEEIFHPHPVLQVNQILQDPSSGGRVAAGGSRMIFWLLLGILSLVLLLGGIKVWMDKAERRHVEEKTRSSTETIEHSSSQTPIPATGGSAQQPSVSPITPPANQGAISQGSEAPASPSVPPATGSTTQPAGDATQNGGGTPSSPGASAPTPTPSVHSTPPASSTHPSSPSPYPAPLSAEKKSGIGTPGLGDTRKGNPVLHRLRVVAIKDTWIVVKEGGDRARRYDLPKGQSKVFRSKEVFRISTRDGGSLLLSLDGKNLGPAGPDGKQVHHKKIIP